MDRRDFIKGVAAAGIGWSVAGWRGAWPESGLARADEAPGAPAPADDGAPPDMVAVRNGEPDKMFERGIAAMGGLERFVKRGQNVCLKVNSSFGRAPEYASDTNPLLVEQIAKQCFAAGAAKVVVVDHTLSRVGEEKCFDNTGIAEAIRKSGARRAPSDAERYYEEKTLAGKRLQKTKIHEAVLEADVLIDIPVLKHHGGAGMSGAIKNLMGVVWDRGYYHGHDLQQCIADFLHARKPDLSVVDAYRVLIGNGPGGGSLADAKLVKMQLISADIVAADAAAAKILGTDPSAYGHIVHAHEMGFGEIDPAKLKTRTLTL